MDISDEVQDGLNRQLPILALESAIITHGLPYPTSMNLPKELEEIARASGTIPAHIAIVQGRIKVGLTDPDLAILADPEQNPKQRWKVGRRELAGAISQGVNGGLTVSATIKIAHMTGIKIFATGGIGGVHRGAQNTMDISSDLTELARTSVAVVCAGAKSILDIGLTLEYLETLGVPVVTVGKFTEFPAFYTAHSGYHASMNCDSVQACARMIRTSELLKLGSGIVFGVPIPKEHSKDGDIIQDAVQQAVRESEDLKINQKGKEVTPWLLQRVNQLTLGRSVTANLALIRNNVAVAAQIAKEYQYLKFPKKEEPRGSRSVCS
ncbi:pseudouridine-5'-phosphate glycosidase [Melampsora americana]|nr:pseudouridine-5'-phosphate glycosidase [Melampsora americana]